MKNKNAWLVSIVLLATTALFMLSLQQGKEALLSQSFSGEQQETEEQAPPERETVSIGGYVLDVGSFQNASPGGVVLRIKEQENPTLPVSLKYQQYPLTYSYLLFEKGGVCVYSEPSEKSPVLKKSSVYEKINYFETVLCKTQGGSLDKWFYVGWKAGDAEQKGYVRSALVKKRNYQFGKMEAALKRSDQYASMGAITYIDNRRSQSAPGYPDLSNLAEFEYLSDGTLVKYLSEKEGYFRVEVLKNGHVLYISRKYVPTTKAITELKRVVAIDRDNQNEAVYEKIEGNWNLISLTLATTGKVGPYSAPTPTGYYFMIQKRERFWYYKDGTTVFQGYAPYALRFTGGAYVHGVPVDYRYDAQGKRIVPPLREYSTSIGTIPLSHKCVRNYTSHAKFLYDWAVPGETIVIVI